MKFSHIIIVSVAALTTTFTTAAQAGPFKFAYRSYELQSETGRAIMLKRAERVATSHCGERGRQPVRQWLKARQCRKLVIQDIVDEVGDSRLAALHAKSTPQVAQN